jgi:sirohydrochlorin cobaltochelatase
MPIISFKEHLPDLGSIKLDSLPLARPLLLIGHGTKDTQGRETFLDFAKIYQDLDQSRPVIPCFLELTPPFIKEGVELCLEKGYQEFSALPLLLFAARHNKFDITNELDHCREHYPQLKFHYGRHLGINPSILELCQKRLAQLDEIENNPNQIARQDTVLLFVGRGSSDPDANSDVVKMARLLWEGTGYLTVETCFIGITHPRLEEGFRRALLYQPKRIIVLPYFLFTGALVKKIFDITAIQEQRHPDISFACLPEMGIQSELLKLVRQREIETQLAQVNMNCEMCKFRQIAGEHNTDHHHHGHEHSHSSGDPYAQLEDYHQKIWLVP